MKRNNILKAALMTGSIFLFLSCLNDDFDALTSDDSGKDSDTETYDYADFDFKTTASISVLIEVNSSENTAIDGVYVELYSINPLTESGTLIEDRESSLLFSGTTNSSGQIESYVSPPATVETVYALSYYTGIERVIGKSADDYITFDFAVTARSSSTAKSTALKAGEVTTVNGYYTLGSWSTYGVPDYLLSTGDQLDVDFLNKVTASLPENSPLPVTHPQYLANNNDASLELKEAGEVWITFVHEGAGWNNSLGYYTYDTGNPPSSVGDITDRTIIFPNVTNSSSALRAGDKVQLQYLDPDTGEYTTVFPAGKTVGWFLIAQGWTGSSQTFGNGLYTHYSNTNLNVESDSDLQKHNVLLWDSERELLLIGFEDIRRDNNGCDQDFNDAIFYASVNPPTAVDNTIYQPIDSPVDSDNDGVSDVFDQYPNDATRAYGNFYPAEDIFGTLIFEDLWPSRGDYDFNDLVVDYNFAQITNSLNQVESVRAEFVVKAIGASYHNAFGIEINTDPSNVASVTGQLNTNDYLDIASNGTENGQDKAVIIIFDDAFNALPYPGSGIGVNVYEDAPYATPDTLVIEIEFINPVNYTSLGVPPYNPFIIIDRNRGVEVHLPGSPPTSLADTDLFGTGDDDSDINSSKYYMSDSYLPWGLNIPISLDYASEKNDIRDAYLYFDSWALSQGYSYPDWYSDKSGYRNNSKIYNK